MSAKFSQQNLSELKWLRMIDELTRMALARFKWNEWMDVLDGLDALLLLVLSRVVMSVVARW